jgi:hypothetical protein
LLLLLSFFLFNNRRATCIREFIVLSLSTPLHNWFHFITERFAGVAMATAGYVYNSQKDGQI